MDRSLPPSLVIFDCDGVLVDSEIISNRLLSEALTGQGIPISEAECHARFTGIAMRSIIAMVEAETGRKLPADFETTVRAHDLEVFARELQPISHIRDALERISLPVCVASSGAPEKIRHSLTITGLLPFFEPHLFSAHMVARGKPAPDVFLLAAERMGANPRDCCVVEDSEAGIQGALAAGMRVLGFAGGGHAGPGYAGMLEKCGPDAVFDDMRDLPSLLGVQAVSNG